MESPRQIVLEALYTCFCLRKVPHFRPKIRPIFREESAKHSLTMKHFQLPCQARWLACAAAITLMGQSMAQLDLHDHVNKANWELANMFTSESLRPYLYSSSLNPSWIHETGKFWYEWRDSTGNKYWIVDTKERTKKLLFNPDKMAAMLTELNYKPIDATTLNIGNITFNEKDSNIMNFALDGMRYEYKIKEEELKKLGEVKRDDSDNNRGPQGFRGFGRQRDFHNWSPDKKSYVYAQAHNLYYVEVGEDKKESDPIQLTTDGERFYSFGSTEPDMGGGGGDDPDDKGKVYPFVTWSKDSKRFYVQRSDSRKVKELWLVNSLSEPRPTLETYKYAMPGDVDVTQTELFAFERAEKELTKLPIARYKDQRIMDVHFQDTSSDAIRFIRRDRLQRNLELVEMNLETLETKVLLTEKTENAFLEIEGVRYVKPGGDFIWFSERTGWGHFYLYSNDGKLKHALTSGPWRANSIAEVDEKKGLVWIEGNGREEGENPYYNHLYVVGLDGKNIRLLNPGNAEHNADLSPDHEYIVDSSSRIDMPTKIVLRDKNGKQIMDLEEMDISRLLAAGWRMPETFVVKAADGVNNIYGNMWKPLDFDPKKKYPIIAYVYPGPQTESVSENFTTITSLQQLAQLGFIVIQIGNRGGDPDRSNAYHSFGYFNLRDYGLADKKAGIEELARHNPWIDVNRVGIYGHSGGGFMTGAALLLPPYNEFFKVGVSSAGNHDNNVYNQNWSEQHHGLKEVPVEKKGSKGQATGRTMSPDLALPETEEEFLLMERYLAQDKEEQEKDKKDGKEQETKFEIHVPANHELAANLKGHLLLVHGGMDNNVHPAGTIRLVNALIKNNKRFDFMILPGKRHGFADMQPYFQQMLMEYFAEHLLGDYYRGSADMKDKGQED